MTDVAFIAVVDAAKVGIRNIPKRTGEVFFPILNPITIGIPSIFTPRGVRLAGVQDTVEIRVLFTVVKCIAIGVVVARVARLRRVAVSTVDLNTIADAVVVRVGRGRVGQEGQRLIGIVQTVAVGIGPNRTGRGHAIHFSRVCRTSPGTDTLNRVTGRGRFCHNTIRSVAETRRRPTHGGPRWVHILEEVDQPVTIGVTVWTVGVGRVGGV